MEDIKTMDCPQCKQTWMYIDGYCPNCGYNKQKQTEIMIKLGNEVKDKVTGLQGIVISRVEYLTGCTQYGVQPQSKDGLMLDSYYIDWNRLELVGHGIDPAFVSSEKDPGGPNRDCPKH